MKRSIIGLPLLIAVCAITAYSQMNLHYLYSRDVKQGYSVQTSVDSLMVDMQVNDGLAKSIYTMVLTPGSIGNSGVEDAKRVLDSIEITASFQLPSDFVADSMWLWVNGERVPANIQDRALASAQYQQIVGVRKDPAILETWGRGSYNLRIFPAESYKSRKIAIEFHHTFNDDSTAGAAPLITACLPIMYDSTYVYYYSSYNSGFEKTIGVVQAHFTAADRKEYAVDIPGVGNGSFSATQALTLSARRVSRLQPGTITSADPSVADEFLWVGSDPLTKGLIAGVSADLSDANMRFESEPDVRIIAIDLRNTMWDWNEYYNTRMEAYNRTYTPYTGYEKYNIWERAQKYAVLALRQYLKDGQKFNVLFGGKSVSSAFAAPVDVSAENLALAVKAIVAAAASPDASTEAIVKTAIEQAPEGIVLLISDLMQPPDYYTYVDNKYTITGPGAAYDSTMGRVKAMVGKSKTTLFTIDDNYLLVQVALESGGYRLSGILNRYNIAYHYEVVEGKRITVPELPNLFGSSNYSGIRDLSVTSNGLTDIAYTIDGYYSNYYYYSSRGGVVMEAGITDDARMVKSLAKMALPTVYNPAVSLVRVAGKLSGDKSGAPIAVTIRGKTGGLWFNHTMNAVGSYGAAGTAAADPQWAFRKSEQLGFDDYVANAAAIKTIGKEYHIVTRQTSLLALEPGMKLWEDTAWQQANGSSDKMATGAAAEVSDASMRATMTDGGAPTSAVGSGVSFDGITLADIIAGKDIAAVVGKPVERRSFSVTAIGSSVKISFTGGQWTEGLSMRLFDLNGRLVAQRSVAPGAINGSTLVWNVAGGTNKLTSGIYSAQLSTAGVTRNFRITLMGN